MEIQEQAEEIIKELRDDGWTDIQIKDSLCNGGWLSDNGYTDEDQALIEEAFNLIK